MNVHLSEAEKIKILNSDDLYKIMQGVLLRENKIDQDREHFWVVGLATNNRILFIELVSKGSVNRVTVEPMEVFSLALQKRAVKIILVHNHPSGELKPSHSDKEITNKLIQVGRIVNTPVVDHLIISTQSYLSFLDVGILAELEKSIEYLPDYKLQQVIKKEAKEIGKVQVNKEKEKIAKKLLKEGMDKETIAKITGLPLDKI